MTLSWHLELEEGDRDIDRERWRNRDKETERQGLTQRKTETDKHL